MNYEVPRSRGPGSIPLTALSVKCHLSGAPRDKPSKYFPRHCLPCVFVPHQDSKSLTQSPQLFLGAINTCPSVNSQSIGPPCCCSSTAHFESNLMGQWDSFPSAAPQEALTRLPKDTKCPSVRVRDQGTRWASRGGTHLFQVRWQLGRQEEPALFCSSSSPSKYSWSFHFSILAFFGNLFFPFVLRWLYFSST